MEYELGRYLIHLRRTQSIDAGQWYDSNTRTRVLFIILWQMEVVRIGEAANPGPSGGSHSDGSVSGPPRDPSDHPPLRQRFCNDGSSGSGQLARLYRNGYGATRWVMNDSGRWQSVPAAEHTATTSAQPQPDAPLASNETHMALGMAWALAHPFLACSDVLDAAMDAGRAHDSVHVPDDPAPNAMDVADDIIRQCDELTAANNADIFTAAFAPIQQKFNVLNQLAPTHASQDDDRWNMEEEIDWRACDEMDWREEAENAAAQEEYDNAVADDARLHCPFHKAQRPALVPPPPLTPYS